MQRVINIYHMLDRGLILFLKQITKNFILKKKNEKINELKIEEAYLINDGEGNNIEEFCENVVMKMQRDA